MWSRLTSPRPRSRAGGGGGGAYGGVGGRRNSSSSTASRPGSVKARDYDLRGGGAGGLHHGSSPATGCRSASIRDRRRRASRGYLDEEDDDLEWGRDGGLGCGGGSTYGEWDDNAREGIRVPIRVGGGGGGAQVTTLLDDEDDEDDNGEGDEEGIDSLDSLTSSHQSSMMGDRGQHRITITGGHRTGIGGGGGGGGEEPTPTGLPAASMASNKSGTDANTSFPRLIPIPARYRIRDFLLGDFSFNDDGERYVDLYIYRLG